MARRMLESSICRSEDIDQLTWFEEVFFYRLIVSVDDYGCFDARPKMLKSVLFPLKDVTLKQVESALSRLSTAGMVRVYEYDRQPYLQLVNWGKYQRLRDSKKRYPWPDDASPLVAASCGELRPELELKVEVEVEPKVLMPGGDALPASAPGSKTVMTITLNDKSEYPITQDLLDKWVELYPAVDVIQELKKYLGWSIANPAKRKTKSGILKSINFWLSGAQDKGGANYGSGANRLSGSADSRFTGSEPEEPGDDVAFGVRTGPHGEIIVGRENPHPRA